MSGLAADPSLNGTWTLGPNDSLTACQREELRFGDAGAVWGWRMAFLGGGVITLQGSWQFPDHSDTISYQTEEPFDAMGPITVVLTDPVPPGSTAPERLVLRCWSRPAFLATVEGEHLTTESGQPLITEKGA